MTFISSKDIKTQCKFGGFMLWDASFDQNNIIDGRKYSDHISDIISQQDEGDQCITDPITTPKPTNPPTEPPTLPVTISSTNHRCGEEKS